jgi:CDP-glucose 4,6-dehydratase
MTFWRGKKVFLTGHTGFKGGWLSLWLQELGADLLGYALPPNTTPNFFTLTQLAEGMKSEIGDIRDFTMLHKSIKAFQPDIIIHMAAQPLVQYSYKEPIETYTTNVIGTVNVLEAARQVESVRAILNVTTDKCYENKEWHWGYRENDTLGGHDPYSNSKACSELVTQAYRSSYFNATEVGLASARAGNVIGGGDWSENRLIPDIIRACMEHRTVLIRNPHALRPWQHVLEPLSGYMKLIESLYQHPKDYSEAWNFGPNDDDVKPVGWIADYATQAWGNHWDHDKNVYPHEATYLKLDCSKAKSRLQWHPRWHLEKGLQATIDWYQAYSRMENMREKSLNQIKNFINQSHLKPVHHQELNVN